MTDMLAKTEDTTVPGFAEGELLSIVERVERKDAELAEVNADKSEIYKEAKSLGFDVSVIKELVKIRKADPEKRSRHETLLELYARATGTRL